MTNGPDTCRIPPSAYIREYLIKYGRIPAAIVAVLLFVALIAGFSDMRWWLIGLMGLFVVVPMLIAMSCFIAVGRKDMALRLHPFTIQQTDNAIRLDFYRFVTEDENPDPFQSVLLSGDNVTRVAYGKKYVRLSVAGAQPFDFILIPKESLPHSTIFENCEYE